MSPPKVTPSPQSGTFLAAPLPYRHGESDSVGRREHGTGFGIQLVGRRPGRTPRPGDNRLSDAAWRRDPAAKAVGPRSRRGSHRSAPFDQPADPAFAAIAEHQRDQRGRNGQFGAGGNLRRRIGAVRTRPAGIENHDRSATVEHEATTSKIGDDQLFYAMQRGLGQEEAVALIVNGFAKEVLQQLPMEFAVEVEKLLGISLEGAVG